MSITKLTANMTVIGRLADHPTETAAELKAKFDEAPTAIAEYINETLTEEVDAALADFSERFDNLQPGIPSGTAAPTGGADGDLYLRY